MFHALALATGWFTSPSSWFLLLQLWALWCLWRGKLRRARILFTVSIGALIAVSLPLPALLIQPLERSFASAPLPKKVDGLVMLAGAERVRLTNAFGEPQFTEDSERATEFIALARKYPDARYIFTGQTAECEVFKMFLASQGFDAKRVVFEEHSKDTYESAINTYQMVQPRSDQVWLLLTSAVHMPRAHGAFSKAGWSIVAHPVAYRASWPLATPDTLQIAVHEWLGIAAYKLTGRM